MISSNIQVNLPVKGSEEIPVPPVWEGHWRSVSHKYLPYQVTVNGKHQNGWVELSVDI
jgi:hypothetical protein